MSSTIDPTDDDPAGATGKDAGTAGAGHDDRPGTWVPPSVAGGASRSQAPWPWPHTLRSTGPDVAIRLDPHGDFVGSVQHTLGLGGIPTVIVRLEGRVPGDQFEACRQAAGKRIHAQACHLTSKAISGLAEKGRRDLAVHRGTATSLSRQADRAARKSAATSVAAGALADLHGLWRHNLNARQFVARRGVDAAQGGITAAVTTTSIAGVTAGATFLASTVTAGTLAATVAGAVAASTAVVPAAVAVAVGYGVSHAANPVRRYLTDRFHGQPENETEGSSDGASRWPTRVTQRAAEGLGGVDRQAVSTARH